MRVIEHKKNELVLIDKDNQVLAVPNTFYFLIKYSKFEGNKISCVLSKKPHMTVYEKKEQEFTCSYNKMKIKIQGSKKINELCEILLEHEKSSDSAQYINFFCKNFAQQNQEEILEIFFKPYSNRIKKDPFPHYIIDNVFGVDKWGRVWVKNPNNKKDFPWDEISLEVKGEFEEYKIIESFNGKDLIMDADLQRFVTKIFYLLNSEKKKNPIFMVQLPKKVQRWVEKGKLNAEIHFNVIKEEEEKIFVPKCYGYFPTPPEVVKTLLEHADIEDGMKVLEPSAGQGHILEYLKNYDVTCGEIYFENKNILKEKGYEITFDDFMIFYPPGKFDRIVMNPPFENQKDIDHVTHAYEMLKEGGKLVSVMSGSVTFRNNKKSKRFRDLVEANGYFEELPDESFSSSGTKVRTVIVVLEK